MARSVPPATKTVLLAQNIYNRIKRTPLAQFRTNNSVDMTLRMHFYPLKLKLIIKR